MVFNLFGNLQKNTQTTYRILLQATQNNQLKRFV